jgi:1-phosphofructokinase
MDDDTRDVCIFAPVTLVTITIEQGAGGEELHIHAGGQGVWVARMVARLGGRPVLCTPVGGETGDVAEHLLRSEGVELRPVRVDAPTGALVQDRRDGRRTDVWSGPSPSLGRHALDDLYSLVLAEALGAGVCVITGTHLEEHVIPLALYERLAGDLASAGVRVIVDLSDAPLRSVLRAGVHLVKVSDEEMAGDGWAEGTGVPQLMTGVDRLLESGAANVVVSRGGAGALAAVDGRRLLVSPPRLDPVDTRGAGDSMTAALALSVAGDADWDTALRTAAAAGTVNVTRHGSGSGRADTVHRLAERTTIERITEVSG